MLQPLGSGRRGVTRGQREILKVRDTGHRAGTIKAKAGMMLNQNVGPVAWLGIHRSTDSICKAEPGTIHESAPKRARLGPKANKNNDKQTTQKTSKPICKFYQDTGKCKFGAKSRFVHDQNNGSNLKGLSQQQKSSIKSFKVGIQKQFQKSNDIDTIVNQFLMVRTIPRECDPVSVLDVSCLSTILVDESSFAFDTGSGEGISVHRKDFVYLDE